MGRYTMGRKPTACGGVERVGLGGKLERGNKNVGVARRYGLWEWYRLVDAAKRYAGLCSN